MYELCLSEIGRVRRLCQHPNNDAMMPIFSPNDPRVRFITDDAIVFCSKIPCITSLSPHISPMISHEIEERFRGKVLQTYDEIRSLRYVYHHTHACSRDWIYHINSYYYSRYIEQPLCPTG